MRRFRAPLVITVLILAGMLAGHAALVTAASGDSSAADTAGQTCAACHGG